jgi:hypothetical protein
MEKKMNPSRITLQILTSLIVISLLASGCSPFSVGAANNVTFTPAADAYVIQSSASANYGTNTSLRVDSSPITRSYLRFAVSGLSGTVTSAKLRMYANSSNSTGYTVKSLSNNSWTETGITYSNAPAPGGSLATSPAITSGKWVEADITSYIKGNGTYNLVLDTTSSTNTSLAARESGANAPQLVVTTNTTGATATATKAGPTATKPAATATKAGPTATKPAATATKPAATATKPAATATKTAATATPASGLTKINLTKGPELVYTKASTSMKIFWQWSSNASFRVDWGTSSGYGSSSPAVSASDTTNHLYNYTITGLTAGTKYYYRVVTGSQYAPGTFYTAPSASATTLKFFSYGDTRSNPTQHDSDAKEVIATYTSDPGYQTLNAFVGDAVADGDSDSTWTSELFATSLTNIRTEMANIVEAPVMGNHEGSGNLFKRYFPEPFAGGRYYSFDYGPAHFIFLDQYTSYSSGSAQYNWFKSDLAGTSKKWKIVVLHEPGWSANGGHANNTTIQNTYQPLFVQYNVALVLGGHNHYYARAMVSGIPELTVGSGGAPAYTPASAQPNIVYTYKGLGFCKFSISGNTLTGTFVTSSGAVKDTFSVTR